MKKEEEINEDVTVKILAFTDFHGELEYMNKLENKIKRFKPDLLICAGDFTIFGNNQEIILNWLNKFNIKLLLIHGNHEFHNEIKKLCKNKKNIELIHKKSLIIGEYQFIGYGGDGFSLEDKQFIDFVKKIKIKKDVILITHGPPFNTVIDLIDKKHCGNKSYTKFIDKVKPILAISGHLHENFNKKQIHKKTYIINPGPDGKILKLNEIKKIISL